MADPREALTQLLTDGLGNQQAAQDWASPGQGRVQLDGWFDPVALADMILATYLVVPRSEVVIEHDRPWTPARHRESWIGPWSPLLENGDGRG